MQIPLVTHPNYSFRFPGRHRFPMEKFGHLSEYLADRGIATKNNVFRPGPVNRSLIEHVHCPAYVNRFVRGRLTGNELKQLSLPWSEGLLARTMISPNGTLLASLLALEHGIACHLAGGTHHAHYDFPSGFCIFNDLALSAQTLLHQKRVDRVLIFDCDVHQGDGTAAMLSEEPDAITVSIHCEHNFPPQKFTSDIDISLPVNTGDQDYLRAIEVTLENAIKDYRPDLILYDAGVDIYQNDPLGRLNVSEQGIRLRDRSVLSFCRDYGIPVTTVIGGGYDDDRQALARRHAIVTEEAVTLWQNRV